MKTSVACLFLLLGVVCSFSPSELTSQITDLHAHIEKTRDFHQANLAEAHETIMGLDLHEHHNNLLATLTAFKPSSSDFETADAVGDCVTAVTTFAGLINAGCNAVFAVFNNSYTDTVAGHTLIATHCDGTCHSTLSSAIANIGAACAPVMPLLQQNSPADFIQRLKAAIVLTEMPCIRSDIDPTKFCFEDVIGLRLINTDPGVGSVPSDVVLAQYCTRCIFKLFSAAATFAPDYARIQFSLMAANCWQFPRGGPYCVRKFNDVVQESQASKDAENGTSIAHLDKLCHPCVRIFLRRVAILYADPLFQNQFLEQSHYLFVFVHIIDAVCLAKGVGDYCVRELLPDINAGLFNSIMPIPGLPCYDSMVAAGSTCPACGTDIQAFVTSHGCCAIALYRLAGLARFLNDPGTLADDNRDDPTFPANKMVIGYNLKCPAQVTQIALYCTAVAINFRVTLYNIAVAVYLESLANRAAFHALVVADIAEFLGMVAKDISVAGPGTTVQGTSAPWYSSYVPSSFVPQDASQGVTLSINVYPDNAAAGDDLSAYVSGSLADGSIPFPNTASDTRFVADPTVVVTAQQSSAATLAVSCLLLVVLALLQL